MNTRIRFNQAIASGAVVVSVITLAAVLSLQVTRAQRGDRDADRHPAVNVLPPAAITFGQTLRVTFLNVGSNPLEIVPCIFDGDGAHLKTGATVTLAPGQMRFLDLSRSEIAGRTESSVEVRAGVHADRPDLKHLMVAGEVIEDLTGKSSLYVPGQNDPPDPVHDGRVTSTLGPVGIAFGQTARLTLLNVGRTPILIDPCFFDSDGMHLKTGATMTLAPGQMRSFELSWSEAAGGRTATRVQVRGAAHVDRRDAKQLLLTGELVEGATGKSSLYVPPGTSKGFDPQPDPPAGREQ